MFVSALCVRCACCLTAAHSAVCRSLILFPPSPPALSLSLWCCGSSLKSESTFVLIKQIFLAIVFCLFCVAKKKKHTHKNHTLSTMTQENNNKQTLRLFQVKCSNLTQTKQKKNNTKRKREKEKEELAYWCKERCTLVCVV